MKNTSTAPRLAAAGHMAHKRQQHPAAPEPAGDGREQPGVLSKVPSPRPRESQGEETGQGKQSREKS